MKLIVTIDTEEDNWARYSSTDNPVENIEEIVQLQKLFDEFEIKPAYMISYPVAATPRSVKILKAIMEKDKCEIGMHCHPWNTPPLDSHEAIRDRDTMLCNLAPETQHAKLAFLHQTISDNFGVPPVSFRAGRWGINNYAVQTLCSLGYRTDSSVTPFLNWQQYHGPDFSNFGPDLFCIDPCERSELDMLLEVPVSVGFLQADFERCRRLMTFVKKPLARRLRLAGFLHWLRIFNLVWLSPEQSDVAQMIKLAERLRKNKSPVLNFAFHSTSLLTGLSPLMNTNAKREEFFARIRKFLIYARRAGFEPQTLAQFEKTMRTSKVKLAVRNFGDLPKSI